MFAIPIQEKDLIEPPPPTTTTNYRVDTDFCSLSVNQLIKQLQGVKTRLEHDPFSVVEHKNFDVLYCMISNFESISSANSRSTILMVLHQSLSNLVSSLLPLLVGPNSDSQQEPSQQSSSQISPGIGMLPNGISFSHAKNAIKMYAFLLHWLVTLLEQEVVGKATLSKGLGRTRGKRKKKDDENEDQFSSIWDEENLREKVVTTLLEAVELDLFRLWNNNTGSTVKKPEEDFLALFHKVAFIMLENPINVRAKDVKRCIFLLVGTLVKRYQLSLTTILSIIQLLHHHDHLSAPLADMMSSMVHDFKNINIVGGVLREIGRIPAKDLAQESSLVKNLSAFISSLADRVPSVVTPSLSVLMHHLDCENYQMRSGILQVMATLVIKRGLGESDEESPQGAGILGDHDPHTRDSLLEVLQERFFDSHALTRSRVLHLWADMFKERVVPLDKLVPITSLTVERLKDKASLVRKSAMGLLSVLLRYNPFAGNLLLSNFEKKLATASTILDELGNQDEERNEEDQAEADRDERRNIPEHLLPHVNDLMKDTPFESAFFEAEKYPLLQKMHKWARDGLNFLTQISIATVTVTELLGSKVPTDVVEAIQFLMACHEFSIEQSEKGIKRMLLLIWADTTIKESVVEAFTKMYVKEKKSLQVARNLTKITQGATLGEVTSLEELTKVMMEAGHITSNVVSHLWDLFAMRTPNTTQQDSYGALMILSMIASAEPDIIEKNINLLVSVGLGARWKEDENIAFYTCISLQKLRFSGKKEVEQGAADEATTKGKKKKTNQEPKKKERKPIPRLPNSHSVFARLQELLLNQDVPETRWFSVAEQAINVIYSLAEHPDVLCGDSLKEIYSRLYGAENVAVGDLCKFTFMLGHIAIKQLAHIETIRQDMELRTTLKKKTVSKKSRNNRQKIEEEMQTEIGEMETEAEALQLRAEKDIITSGLLGKFVPFLVTICANKKGNFNNPTLRASAVLSLCKFMCISKNFCEDHLQLLFTLLQTAPEPSIRSNIIMTLGDLCYRFPNSVEPWTPNIYAPLLDADASVRKNTVMVLTHLILNDMVKVKGQISNLAFSLEDKNERVAQLVRLFFNELSQKGNSIYNILPDTISSLSNNPSLSTDSFRNIVQYLFSFLKKERQFESLLEKLCQRFHVTQELRHWRYIAYCLSLLTYNEKCIRKLIDLFPSYHDKLPDDDVNQSFMSIINKSKKVCKDAVEELEKKIREGSHQSLPKGCTDESTDVSLSRVNSSKRGRGGRVLGGKKAAGISRPKKDLRTDEREPILNSSDESSESIEFFSCESDKDAATSPKHFQKTLKESKKGTKQSPISKNEPNKEDGSIPKSTRKTTPKGNTSKKRPPTSRRTRKKKAPEKFTSSEEEVETKPRKRQIPDVPIRAGRKAKTQAMQKTKKQAMLIESDTEEDNSRQSDSESEEQPLIRRRKLKARTIEADTDTD